MARHINEKHSWNEYSNPTDCECPVSVIEFDDEFGAYEIWEL